MHKAKYIKSLKYSAWRSANKALYKCHQPNITGRGSVLLFCLDISLPIMLKPVPCVKNAQTYAA